MALTEIDVHLLEDRKTRGPLIVGSAVRFGQECLVNQYDILKLFNVFWIRQGTAEISIDFKKFQVTGNSLFFLFPGQVFAVVAERKHIHGYRLAFDPDFYCLEAHHPEVGCNGLLFNKLNLTPVVRVKSKASAELDEILTRIIDNMHQSELAQSEIVQSYLKIFLIRCVQIKKHQVAAVANLGEETLLWLSELNGLIEKHFRQWHSVAEYAQSLNMSPKSLTKKMARYGLTPSQLIQDRILLEAKRMLYYGKKSSKEVAFELGFKDPSYFSRFFKSKSGKTPGEFLEQAPI